MPLCSKKYMGGLCNNPSLCKETGVEKCFKPYPPRMTDVEFAEKQKEILSEIPDEFKSTLSYMAYEQGHSAGYEEILLVLQNLVDNLLEPINKFRESIKNQQDLPKKA